MRLRLSYMLAGTLTVALTGCYAGSGTSLSFPLKNRSPKIEGITVNAEPGTSEPAKTGLKVETKADIKVILVKTNTDVQLSCQASDPDGDLVKVSVLLSSDGGQNWQTVASDVDGASYAMDAATLKPGDSYWVKLIATDGVLTGSAVSGSFSVQPPSRKTYLPLVLKPLIR